MKEARGSVQLTSKRVRGFPVYRINGPELWSRISSRDPRVATSRWQHVRPLFAFHWSLLQTQTSCQQSAWDFKNRSKASEFLYPFPIKYSGNLALQSLSFVSWTRRPPARTFNTMRRAQSVRNYIRPSLALATDDLGVLREGDESNEDVLRRQLLEKDRECDRVRWPPSPKILINA